MGNNFQDLQQQKEKYGRYLLVIANSRGISFFSLLIEYLCSSRDPEHGAEQGRDGRQRGAGLGKTEEQGQEFGQSDSERGASLGGIPQAQGEEQRGGQEEQDADQAAHAGHPGESREAARRERQAG